MSGNEAEVLDWPKRLKIALGAAKGLAYLHEDCMYSFCTIKYIESINTLTSNGLKNRHYC